jgi:ribosomal-protein-serine acetyltransferase
MREPREVWQNAPMSLRSLPVSTEHPAGALVHRGVPEAILRPVGLTDAEPLAAAIEASAPELRTFMQWAHLPQTALDQLARIKTTLAEYHAGRSLQMVLTAPGGEILSICGLEKRVPLNPRGWEIGYWTPTPRAGRGYATLATKLLTLYAFDLLGADRVQLLVDEANVGSARVATKVGFVEEGRLMHLTPAGSPEIVARGYRRSDRTIVFALWPTAYAALSWPTEVRRTLEVKNLLGHTVTGFWS